MELAEHFLAPRRGFSRLTSPIPCPSLVLLPPWCFLAGNVLGVFVFHWKIKGRFRKRVVLANVPSFRFSFRGNIRRSHPFGNHPFVNTKKGHWEIKGRFPKGWFWRTYPRSGFRSGGTSAKTTLLETTLLRTPEFSACFPRFFNVRKVMKFLDASEVFLGKRPKEQGKEGQNLALS